MIDLLRFNDASRPREGDFYKTNHYFVLNSRIPKITPQKKGPQDPKKEVQRPSTTGRDGPHSH